MSKMSKMTHKFIAASQVKGVIKNLTEAASNSQDKDNSDVTLASLTGQFIKKRRGPIFNLDHFRSGFHSLMWLQRPEIRTILIKEPSKRTDDEVMKLHSCIEHLDQFSHFSSEVQLELCRVLMYLKFGPDRVIVRQGDSGDSSYFILSGSVFVKTQKKYDDVSYHDINELDAGENFGEMTLITGQTVRTETVVTKEETEFLRVAQSDFAVIIENTQRATFNERLDFLTKVFTLQDEKGGHDKGTAIPHESIVQITQNITRTARYDANTCIIQEGAPSDSFYFIRSGQCRVVRTLQVPVRDVSDAKHGQQPYCSPAPSPLSRDDSIEMVTKHLQLHLLSTFSYFGEVELMMNIPRIASVISVGVVVCYVLNRSSFTKYLADKHGDFLRARVNIYASDEEVMDSYYNAHSWNSYRQAVVREVMGDKITKMALINRLFKNNSANSVVSAERLIERKHREHERLLKSSRRSESAYATLQHVSVAVSRAQSPVKTDRLVQSAPRTRTHRSTETECRRPCSSRIRHRTTSSRCSTADRVSSLSSKIGSKESMAKSRESICSTRPSTGDGKLRKTLPELIERQKKRLEKQEKDHESKLLSFATSTEKRFYKNKRRAIETLEADIRENDKALRLLPRVKRNVAQPLPVSQNPKSAVILRQAAERLSRKADRTTELAPDVLSIPVRESASLRQYHVDTQAMNKLFISQKYKQISEATTKIQQKIAVRSSSKHSPTSEPKRETASKIIKQDSDSDDDAAAVAALIASGGKSNASIKVI